MPKIVISLMREGSTLPQVAQHRATIVFTEISRDVQIYGLSRAAQRRSTIFKIEMARPSTVNINVGDMIEVLEKEPPITAEQDSDSVRIDKVHRILAHLIRNEGVEPTAIERAVVSARDIRVGEHTCLTGMDASMRRAFVTEQVGRLR